MERLLTYQEAAEQLAVTARAVARLVASGRLHAVDLGHRTKRIRPHDLTTFVNSDGGAMSVSHCESGRVVA